MLDSAKIAAHSVVLSLLLVCGLRAGELPGDWSGDFPPCDRNHELLKRDRMHLGVRFSASDPLVSEAFARALDFWGTVVEMEWHEENTRSCSLHVVAGPPELFQSKEAARAQFPGSPSFQGWIAINPQVVLSAEEQYLLAVHELGHLLGLHHNPSARSVMYFFCFEGPVRLDGTDLAALAARHKLRVAASSLEVQTSSRGNPQRQIVDRFAATN